MQDEQRYEEAIDCLETHGYDVLPSPPGYIVCNRSDHADRSYARHLNDLVELAELFEWAARHYYSRSGGGKDVAWCLTTLSCRQFLHSSAVITDNPIVRFVQILNFPKTKIDL